MIKDLNENTALKLKSLNEAEKKAKGVLGRLYGPVASFASPTRNGRKYTQALWEKLFESDLIKERFANGGIFGQLCHPDYSEVDMEKIACVMPEPPVKDEDGNLIAYVDLIDTPCGRIAYQLAKYGYKFGISSRGEGDLIDGPDGEEVDPDTYQLNAFDLVEIPAVENARLTFTESLDKKRYNKTLRSVLQESLAKANEDERKVMNEALDNLGISLEEGESIHPDLQNKEPIKGEHPFTSQADPEAVKKVFEIFDSMSDEEYDALIDNGSRAYMDNDPEAKAWVRKLFRKYQLPMWALKAFEENWDEQNITESAEDRYAEFNPEDAELHKNTDWKARNYTDLPVPEDSFDHEVTFYRNGQEPEKKTVKVIKYLRSNPIYPPYYAPEEKPFDDSALGPMYDGKFYNMYDIHDRYEDQETYDHLSESDKDERLISKLRDSQELEEDALDDAGVSKAPAKEYAEKMPDTKFTCAGHEVLGKDLLDYFEPDEEVEEAINPDLQNKEPIKGEHPFTSQADPEAVKKVFEIFDSMSDEEYDALIDNGSKAYMDNNPEAKAWVRQLFRKYKLPMWALKAFEENWDEQNLEESMPAPKEASILSPEEEDKLNKDREDHYKEMGGEPFAAEKEKAHQAFEKSINPPYYAPEEKPFGDSALGPMYDIHDRYEDQETYDHLSEARINEDSLDDVGVSKRSVQWLVDKNPNREFTCQGHKVLGKDLLDYFGSDEVLFLDNDNIVSTGSDWNQVLNSAKLTNESLSFEEAEKYFEEKGLTLTKDVYNLILQMNSQDNDMVQERLISKLRDSQEVNEECNSESCTDKEDSKEVANDKSEKELVAEFQESLQQIKKLDEDNLSLKEQLSVCIAKENDLQEQLAKYKKATANLSDTAKEVKPLKESLDKKDKVIKANKTRISNLIESIKEKNSSVEELTESNNQLGEKIKSLSESLENISKQLENSKQLAEKYRKNYSIAKENLLEAKANVYGISKEDLKKNLTESYKIKDIDSICEKLVKQRNKLDKLPIRLDSNTKINFSNTSDSLVEGLNKNDDDYISDFLKSI